VAHQVDTRCKPRVSVGPTPPRFEQPLELIAPGGSRSQAAAACPYEERIVDLSDSIVSLGDDVGGAIENAADKTDEQLARQFASFSRRMRRNERRLAALDPPEALRQSHEAFRRAIPPIRRDLFGIARAARNHDADAARTWTERLIEHSPQLRKSRRALVRRVKARIRENRCD
jgi:hypothetical protein